MTYTLEVTIGGLPCLRKYRQKDDSTLRQWQRPLQRIITFLTLGSFLERYLTLKAVIPIVGGIQLQKVVQIYLTIAEEINYITSVQRRYSGQPQLFGQCCFG